MKRRGVSRSPFAKSPSKVNKNKLSKITMTMMLEELKELRRMVGMKKTSDSPRELWGCKQCLSNPTSWKEPRGIFGVLLYHNDFIIYGANLFLWY